jgi:predicted small lipoprotein YifL
MRRQRLLVRLMLVGLLGALALAPAACGRKGNPVLPPPQTDEFPHQYPKTTDPQTGVFN